MTRKHPKRNGRKTAKDAFLRLYGGTVTGRMSSRPLPFSQVMPKNLPPGTYAAKIVGINTDLKGSRADFIIGDDIYDYKTAAKENPFTIWVDEATDLPEVSDYSAIEKRILAWYSTPFFKPKGSNTMGIHTVRIRYPRNEISHSKPYYYLTKDGSIKGGDWINVNSALTGPTVVQVEEINHNFKDDRASKFIIGKVDVNAHLEDERLERIRQSELNVVKDAISRTNDALKAREERIRSDMIRDRLNNDSQYQMLVDQLHGLALQQRALEGKD